MYKYDAIIELGYHFDIQMRIPLTQVHSVYETAALYAEQTAPLIIVSGKWSIIFDRADIVPPVTEAEVMKKQLTARGVPPDAIVKEELSKDTVSNAYYTKVTIAEPRRLKKLLVVCADFHALRVLYIFHKIYGSGYTVDCHAIATPVNGAVNREEEELLKKVQTFLSPMKDGDDGYLKDAFFTHPYFQV